MSYFIGLRTRLENKLEKHDELKTATEIMKVYARRRDTLDVTLYNEDGKQLDYARGMFAGYSNT